MARTINVGTLISGGGTNLQAIIDACSDGSINGKIDTKIDTSVVTKMFIREEK